MLAIYFANDEERLWQYLYRALGEMAIVENHQRQFWSEFVGYISGHGNMQCKNPTRWNVTNQRISATATSCEYVFYYAPSPRSEAMPSEVNPGFNSIPIDTALGFVLFFLARERKRDSERYLSLTDIPLPFLSPFLLSTLPADDFSRTFAERIFHHNSIDRTQWWRNTIGPVFLDVFYPYYYIETLSDDIHMLRNLCGTIESPAEKYLATDHVNQRSFGELEPGRVGLTCYYYLFYAMVHPWIASSPEWAEHQALQYDAVRAQQPLNIAIAPGIPWRSSDSVHGLFPVFFSMVSGRIPLDSTHPYMIELFRRDNGSTMNRLSELAEDVRELLLGQGPPMDESSITISKRMLLTRLYERTLSLTSGSQVFRAACCATLRDASAANKRRQVNIRLTRVPFGAFLHELETQLHGEERRRIHSWIKDNLSRHFQVRLEDVLSAESITRHTDPMERHANAATLLEHLQECDKNVIVMRFPDGVTLEEIRLSLDYYRAIYLYLDHHRDSFYYGLDDQGVFLIAERRQHALLTQVMFLVSATTVGFRHNIPLFPLLSRLYFTVYNALSISDKEGDEKVAPAFFVRSNGNNSMESDYDPRVDITIDDHALMCFVTLIGHWLGVPTNAPSDKAVSIDQDNPVKLHSQPHKAGTHGDWSLRDAPLSAWAEAFFTGPDGKRSQEVKNVARVYIPEAHEEEFNCMRLLHRFVARIEEARGEPMSQLREIPDGIADALAGYLEMKRPRLLDLPLAIRLASELRAYGRVPLAEMLEELIQEREKKGETEAPFVQRKPKRRKRNNPNKDKVPKEKRAPAMTIVIEKPWPIYAAAIDAHMSGETFRALFLQGHTCWQPMGRKRTKRKRLRKSAVVSDETSSASQATRNFTGGYSRIFVVPYSASKRRMAYEFSSMREPIEGLAHLVRVLEATVAPVVLAEALGSTTRKSGLGSRPPPPPDLSSEMQRGAPTAFAMDNATSTRLVTSFNFYEFLGARGVATTVEWLPPGAALQPDGRSMIPLQIWPGAEGEANQRNKVMYYESFFSIVSFLGGTYANHLVEHGFHERSVALEAFGENREEYASAIRPIRVDLPTAPHTDIHLSIPTRTEVRQHRHVFTGALSLAMRYGYLADTAPRPNVAMIERHHILSRFVQELLYRESMSLKIMSLPPITDPLPRQIVIHARAFPHKFESYAHLCRFVTDVLRAPLLGESADQRASRLQSMAKNKHRTNLMTFMARLYELCDSVVTEPTEDPEGTSYTNEQVEAQALERLNEPYAAIVQEAMRRGTLSAVVTGNASAMTIEQFFEEQHARRNTQI